MLSAGAPTTVRRMKPPNRKSRTEAGTDPNLYSELRKRNERRARVAALLDDRRRRLEQIAGARRHRTTRHAG
jgi:hypothetical protein